MTIVTRLGCFVGVLAAWFVAASPSLGQETPKPAEPPSAAPAAAASEAPAPKGERRPSPLGVRQQRVERMMDDLQQRFQRLSQTLEETEPDRAKRLIETLQQSKQLQIQQRMQKIAQMLDETRLDSASGEQKQIIADLRALIAMLLEDEKSEEKLSEQERLQQLREQLENILQEQRAEQRETDQVARREEALAELAARIKALEKLIEQQKGVVAQAQSARTQGAQAVGKIGRAHV